MIPQALTDARDSVLAVFRDLERALRSQDRNTAIRLLYNALMALATYRSLWKQQFDGSCHPANNPFLGVDPARRWETVCAALVGQRGRKAYDDNVKYPAPFVFFAALQEINPNYMNLLPPEWQAAVRATGLPVGAGFDPNVHTLGPQSNGTITDRDVRLFKLKYLASRTDPNTRMQAIQAAQSLPAAEQALFFNDMRHLFPRISEAERAAYLDMAQRAEGVLSGAVGCPGCGGTCGQKSASVGCGACAVALSGALGDGSPAETITIEDDGQSTFSPSPSPSSPSSSATKGTSAKEFLDILNQLVKGGIGIGAAVQKANMDAATFELCKTNPQHQACPWNKPGGSGLTSLQLAQLLAARNAPTAPVATTNNNTRNLALLAGGVGVMLLLLNQSSQPSYMMAQPQYMPQQPYRPPQYQLRTY